MCCMSYTILCQMCVCVCVCLSDCLSVCLSTGCGTGNYTVALSDFVGKVTGLELNEGMLGRAMEKTAALKNVTVMQGDITNMPFQDSQFDGLCCNQVIIYSSLSDNGHSKKHKSL